MTSSVRFRLTLGGAAALWCALALPIGVAAQTTPPDVAPEPPAPPSTIDVKALIKHAQAEAKRALADARVQGLDRELEQLAQVDAELDLDELPALAFVSSELASPREIVKNAPYTAEAVSESVQVLSDGNRIVKRSTTLLARDTYGRTRQEKQGVHGTRVYVYDPIADRTFVINPDRKTATRIPRVPPVPEPPAPPGAHALAMAPVPPSPPTPAMAPAPPTPPEAPGTPGGAPAPRARSGERVIVRRGDGDDPQDVRVEVIRVGRDGGALVAPMPPSMLMPPTPHLKGETKSLGTRDFDGVKADGTQTTHTIPAGEIGNERPIVITSERWFSPELQLVVFAKTTDPRRGETTYKLAHLKRSEPAADLFKVPAGYKGRG